jgi:hypothetical protein
MPYRSIHGDTALIANASTAMIAELAAACHVAMSMLKTLRPLATTCVAKATPKTKHKVQAIPRAPLILTTPFQNKIPAQSIGWAACFFTLQRGHATTRFSGPLDPPSLSGVTWSTWKF